MKDLLVQGHMIDRLRVISLLSSCGSIKTGEGIGLAHGDEGGWVIKFADIKRLYYAACKVRNVKP